MVEVVLSAKIERWFRHQCAAWQQAGVPAPGTVHLRITPALAEWEIVLLEAALDDGLFQPDPERGWEIQLFADNTQSPYSIFSKGPPPRVLRENVCQLAAAARLIYERGWLPSHVALRPTRSEHSAAVGAFDLFVQSPDGHALIWVETRRSGVELQKLIADLGACSRRGPHAHVDCGFPQNHPRHEFARTTRPEYLWAMAPDADFSFALQHNGSALELEPLRTVPPRSVLE